MREMLEPFFGTNGAVVAQFVITLIVVLALVGVVVWLVRRYAAGGLGTTVRGRLPRLAVVDALAVDARRKLVLIRHDNVEHLVLIGGPADIVVEHGIVRARTVSQRSAGAVATAQQASAPTAPAANPPAPVEEVAAARPTIAPPDEPIPFPPRRVERPQARRELPRQVVAQREPEVALQRRALRPAAVELAAAEEARVTPFAPLDRQPAYEEPMPAMEPEAPPIMAAPVEEPEPAPPPATDTGLFTEPLELVEPEAPDAGPHDGQPAGEENPPAAGEPTPSMRVNDLEREMARLLGEISSRRSS